MLSSSKPSNSCLSTNIRFCNNLTHFVPHFLKVWNHYGSGRICDAVDPRLEGNFQLEEASRLFQIGLLCVQASAELRPAMSMVVKMLTDNHQIIPQPTQPPFLNTSIEIKRGTSSTGYNSQQGSNTQSSGNNMTESWIEPR